MWLAPNLITLAGTLLIVEAYLLNMWYSPTFTGAARVWALPLPIGVRWSKANWFCW